MSAYIHHISTLAAPFSYQQDTVRERMMGWTSDERHRRLLSALYKRSGIETRHSVLESFFETGGHGLFQPNGDNRPGNPGTAERNARYASASREMSEQVARRALQDSGFTAREVTHVIYVTCTGFVNPGPELHLVEALGMDPGVERYTLGFMGCYAAFPALRMASQFCKAREDAVVLVVCLELCTLHLQLEDKPDVMLANSLFADGAAAAVVSARTPAVDRPAYRLDGFISELVPSGASHMAWDIGNHGFEIKLSSYVPEILGGEMETLMARVLDKQGCSPEDITEWAVHPGGRAILDKVQQGLRLPETALASSRRVLRTHGNMSSATVLFVLRDLLDTTAPKEGATCAMAFGPGLTVEVALLKRVGCKPRLRGMEITALQTLHETASNG
ncbi:putative naringenin-chalcone synthase [Roseimicrobium gellanilyticum]|uniref:Putative naringenin-chalcone synthase n=1 Tax=Roseimicrobium gellanilyticum TaxID=748857 RepID=A0A366H7N8_9BACT|nr:type III polyketide synthase [Roseimicrobium gellanilyticum]RBP38182.1 putative naringenin-chalcone synthase [Roseimicrobium gellanilyticum]